MKIFSLLLIGVLALNGCASMSKSECLSADWLVSGIEDGRKGVPLSRLDDHAKACGKVDVVPNAALYAQGHAQGVLNYCTPERALHEGSQDNAYAGVCPPELEEAFIRSYIDGLELHVLELENRTINEQSRLTGYRIQQSALGSQSDKKLLSRIASAQANITTNASKRLQLRQKIASLRLSLNP